MPLFTSTYTNRVDKKGRVSVPAAFRSTLPDGDQSIAVLPSLGSRAIEGFDYSYLEHISERLDNFDMLTSPGRAQDPAAKILSRSISISIDSDGRIVLPRDFINHAGIVDRAVFVGLGRTFQIWAPAEYDAVLARDEGA
ncbi:MAG: division/cell wall cluster transcriptional repressor MraZ [Alphaproteobacteria bacterium]|nr:division/cell wall cluster transcriptional repressor MraZ [Alphaproteobacteria bacterium]